MNRQAAVRWVTILTGLIVLISGVISIAQWTLIPMRIDSRITKVHYQDSTSLHLRTLTLADGRTFIVDQVLIERAGGPKALQGALIHKERWERHVDVDGRSVPLPITLDMWRTLGALVFLVGLGGWARRKGLGPA